METQTLTKELEQTGLLGGLPRLDLQGVVGEKARKLKVEGAGVVGLRGVKGGREALM